MPAKARGGRSRARAQHQSLDNGPRHSPVAPIVSTPQNTRLARNTIQPKFTIAPLILENTKLNKMQLNDIIKQHMSDIKLNDIQLSRTGTFTLYAYDVKSFNRLLNDLPAVLATNNQTTAKLFVPRSIQRIKDTEKVAFVKRVDLEIPEDRIMAALKDLGLDATNVTRLTSKDGNTPTRTMKVMFADAENRNTFVHTGLQVDSMHFPAEPATQNTKPVQCYICMQYNHIAKYCKTKQQVCARCGDNHRLDQCSAPADTYKCCNCNGNHLASSVDCPKYKEQEKKAQNLVNQYITARQPNAWAPAVHNSTEFPPLQNSQQPQKPQITKDFLDEIITMLSSQMEKIIEETTNRILITLQQKVEKLEKLVSSSESTTSTLTTTTDSLTTTNPATTTKPQTKTTKPTTTTTTKDNAKILAQSSQVDASKESQTAKGKRNNTTDTTTTDKQNDPTKRKIGEVNSSFDTSTGENKDLKISNDDD
ncbi:unnamed protein product [Adineta ricciae]|uniref:Gag-like protein n=1 Tax=Adineta ricciae TaxID=249248 RepID=A0A814B6D3_ADIRI|nr:unnamed protein product [Adineta ricciae]CAF1141046.1 unnamed protein product [Adineta ricciae]